MNRRGHTLLLVMAVIAALLAGATVVYGKLSGQAQQRPARELRVQALWLARSALSAGVTGSREVWTPHGLARVRVERQGSVVSAQVELGGARASLRSDPYQERYQPKAGLFLP